MTQVAFKHPASRPSQVNKGEGLNEIRKILNLLTRKWYLFFIFLPVAIGIGWLQLQLAIPVYRASATMMFKLDPNRNIPHSVLTEGFGLSPEMRLLENQTFIIRNHSMVLRAVNRLDFGVSYYAKGRFVNRGLYRTAPFEVRIDSTHPQLLNTPLKFNFQPDGLVHLTVSSEGGTLHDFETATNVGVSGSFDFETFFRPGEQVTHPAFQFSLNPSGHAGFLPTSGEFHVIFRSHADVASHFLSTLTVSQYSEESSIMFLTVTGDQPQKLVNFLNVFSEEIILDNLARKNDIATNSINFIQGQLQQIADTLAVTGQKIMNFKRDNRFIMPSDAAEQISSEFFEIEQERWQLEASLDYFNEVKAKLTGDNFKESDVMLPALSNQTVQIINQFVLEYLTLLNDYNLIGSQAGNLNPYQKELAQKIDLSKANLLSAIEKQMESIQMQIDLVNAREETIRARMEGLPELERDFMALERTHALNDAIYTFLLQKNSEMQISKASNVPDNELLGPASATGPISPVSRRIFSRAILAGLFIPLMIIIGMELFNNKIRSREDITLMFSEIPLIGTITRNGDAGELVVKNKPDSIIAESFRSLRVKIRYFFKDDHGKAIVVTSSNKGEGKTFCAVNLATVLALSGKKTLLIEFDLRKPRLGSIFNLNSYIGVSNYLIGQVKFDEIIQSTSQENLSLIPAGLVPPNPSELISTSFTADLFEKARDKFDYLVIDTPPIGLVSDARLLMDYGDCHLFVVRADVTQKDQLSTTLRSLVSERVGGLALVLNDLSQTVYSKGYYNSGYFSR